MSIWSSYPFVRITLSFCLGILIYQRFSSATSICVLILLLIGFYLLNLIHKKRHPGYLSVLNGMIIISTITLLGVLRASFQDLSSTPDNLVNADPTGFETFHMRIDGFPVVKDKHLIYEATLLSGLSNPSPDSTGTESLSPLSGKISLYIRKDSIDSPPSYGDILITIKKPFLLATPKNPHEFDYSDYMARKGIYHQLFLNRKDFKIIGHHPQNAMISLSYQARLYFRDVLTNSLTRQTSRDIALALVLGIKDNLDKDLKSAYSSAGAMHVLAVSGLHVGIIHMLLSSLLGFMKKYRSGRFLFLTCSLLCLWGYAFITGLSPSVLRAVIMFSIVLIGDNMLRFHNIYNSLAVSAFFILLYNPFMLMEVGFQLSYTAVLGIVSLQPGIYRLLTIKNKLLDKAWSITCVSIAAQAATFPIGLYYFHQFPTYFLVSNLVVIPAAFIILLNGLMVLFFSLISDLLTNWLGYILDLLTDLLNQSVLLVNWLPYSLIDRIRLDLVQLVITYVLMLSVIFLFRKKSASYLRLSLLTCLLFIVISGQQAYTSTLKKEIVFYEVRDNLLVDFISSGRVRTFLKNPEDDHDLINYQIGPNRLACALPGFNSSQLISATDVTAVGKLITWNGVRIFIIDQELRSLQFSKQIETDILVLSGNHFVPIDQLTNTFSWKQLIIDSSYKKYRATGLSRALDKENIGHWNINTDGAYIFSLN